MDGEDDVKKNDRWKFKTQHFAWLLLVEKTKTEAFSTQGKPRT